MMDNATEENGTLFNDNNTTSLPIQTPKPFTWPGLKLMMDTFTFVEVYLYFSFVIGIPGNIFTLIVLFRLKPINSSYVWLGAMATVDLVSLLARAAIVPFIINWVFYYSEPLCIFENIVVKWTEHTNYLYLMSMTAERLIAVWFPLKMSSWCNPKRASIGAGVILFVTLACEAHNFETTSSLPSNSCYTKVKYVDFWFHIYLDKLQTFLFRLTPLFSLIAMNFLIVIGLRRRSIIMTKMSDEQIKEKMKQQRQINRLLTVATAFFFVSLGLENIFRLVRPHLGDASKSWPLSRDRNIVRNVAAALSVGNHAGNFYLYVIAAKKFRNEFLHLMTGGRYGEHNGTKGTLVVKKG